MQILYCVSEIVPLCAKRRYQPIRIAYLLSLPILNGASSEITGAERTLLLFSQFWTGSWKIFLKISNSLVSANCLEFNDILFVSKTF